MDNNKEKKDKNGLGMYVYVDAYGNATTQTLYTDGANRYFDTFVDANGGDIVVGSGKPAVPDPDFTVSASASQYCKDSTYKVTWTMSGDAADRTYSLNWGTGASSTEISVSTVKASFISFLSNTITVNQQGP